MPRIRLTGLFLFITSIFLALAAAATKTTHIDIKKRDSVVAENVRDANAAQGNLPTPGLDNNATAILPPPAGPNIGQPSVPPAGLPGDLPGDLSGALPGSSDLRGETQPGDKAGDGEKPVVAFRSVPIVYPLFAVGTIGLLLWFVPAAEFPGIGSAPRKKKRSRRRSSRSSSGNTSLRATSTGRGVRSNSVNKRWTFFRR